MIKRQQETAFVEDGKRRAAIGSEPEIRQAVELEFQAQLQDASPWRRFCIRREMEREVRSRVRRAAPSDALY
jgi:hypothetical protein